ncbi:bifunctional proline dehydrogenase/L-glutamate gamma-semialdehyde dehydrogenase PutA [Nitrosomonas sp. Nm132]|uniref:bifunctional proline dehydrogenase/L-glutamate gamma-semialdehyde dehydrogenase PutA n=1 Tax=Nitrosomonas sp. Nm132 TaxID=1881053 RepID=UPI000889642E|nr:bifunctional proline dehydrogenase/L-glutamate gamma-semialdehyde dehydrogenase PutA [Nitrosomonas sp. Nm132]SDH74691.1 RHH-type transcriptional regulator, proline utilization regulon repressor / proline dehydrogenase / delta 1-pyrroline-5-carboxylate dehydrogenase [Nitrosomonas sp. Nm132]
MIHETPLPSLTFARVAINRAYLYDEAECLNTLLSLATLDERKQAQVEALARQLVNQVRGMEWARNGIDALLHEYDLSTQEGVLLMSLAEALLRIPDAATADRLIQDKLSSAEWDRHLGHSSSFFANASTWGLLLTGKIVKLEASSSLFNRLISRSGEPVIRMVIKQAMRLIGHQFVMGGTLDEALKHSRDDENRRYRYSFDMLGEAALTAADAARYFADYYHAIIALGEQTGQGELFDHPGISVKLSALHPRYEYANRQRVLDELSPRLLELALAAKAVNISMTIDAEEVERLDLSLDLFETVYRNDKLTGWSGFGLAVQAYQKRAIHVIDWLAQLASECKRPIPVRLVKGAYWDAEIKQAQERGLDGYPVFTRKLATDVSYLACARRLLDRGDLFYPQFATHNARAVATLIVMAGSHPFEFQRLHGMGEALYAAAFDEHPQFNCRVYAPVGNYKELLPYLVRRLLENGANSSFVNRIANEQITVEEIIADPVSGLARYPQCISTPRHLYGKERLNASGINLAEAEAQMQLDQALEKACRQLWHAAPIVDGYILAGRAQNILNPADHNDVVGEAALADSSAVDRALSIAHDAAFEWASSSASERAALLERAADLFEEQRAELMSLIIREGGRTLHDALSEVREAIDFCRYYADQARRYFDHAITLPGVTGESNQLRLAGRGVFICISPWNFPISIFTGQIAAALAAGNSVIAKPAALSPLCAAHVVGLLHKAGIPGEVLHFIPGSGSEIGMQLVSDARIAGIAFTGSTSTARQINQVLSQGERILPFIAETGGQNCMIVDSSALPEQVVKDVIASAFNSAGQRCSALRVLFLQQEVAAQIMEMLGGAMDELRIGNPMRLSTDIGPIISLSACAGLQQHSERMNSEARLIKTMPLPQGNEQGSYFAPRVYQIEKLSQLQHEVFGPILHIIQYQASRLNEVVDAINHSGYGLTLGIHSRINTTIDYIARHARCGNIYVNRNIIGAIVGSQPFGGEGFSGTGPKAGGPHYLQRFATERVVTINTAAVGGNVTLLSLGGADIRSTKD